MIPIKLFNIVDTFRIILEKMKITVYIVKHNRFSHHNIIGSSMTIQKNNPLYAYHKNIV